MFCCKKQLSPCCCHLGVSSLKTALEEAIRGVDLFVGLRSFLGEKLQLSDINYQLF